MTRIVGIDPGVEPAFALKDLKTGQIEFFDDGFNVVKRGKKAHKEPNVALLAHRLRTWGPDIVILEHVNPISGQGLASTGTFMRAFGQLEGLIVGLGFPYQLVRPQQWQRDLRVKSGHDEARAKVLQWYPGLASELSRKKDHNRAAALLLAIWGEKIALRDHPLFVD